MSGSSFHNGPSRKSRFRPQRPGEERRIESVASSAELKLDVPPAGERAVDPAVPASELVSGAPVVMRPRQPVPRERYSRKPSIFKRWRVPLQRAALLLFGLLAGYLIGVFAGPSHSASRRPDRGPETVGVATPISEEERAELDRAYSAGKARRFQESIQLLNALAKKHPAWIKLPIDIARMEIYQRQSIPAKRILASFTQGNSDARADAFFLLGVLGLTGRDYTDAEMAFAEATDVDPTRSEFYYFWGDSLRLEGKPAEAGVRFRSALNRNQFETAEDLLQLKVWLCDLMTDQAKSDQASAEIDEALAKPFPRGGVFLAAAARSIKAEHFAEAAGFITRGEAAMDPAVFNVVLVDPTFVQEAWRPELAPFYERARAAATAAANTGAPREKGEATSPAAPGH